MLICTNCVNMGILERISEVSDIKKLNIKELEQLADEIRREILASTLKNGGHLSSNLGIVETTIALYYTFDLPTDKLIFDVGHQCYAHKLLSGRKDRFSTIRTDNGISGFPDIDESEFDSFTVGHAGTSIASSLGLCFARDAKKENYTVIDVVGDGSVGNGLNLEAISSSQTKPKNLIVILNDNGMSISKNKNGFYQYLSKSTTKRGYIGSKRVLQKVFGNSFITKGLTAFKGFIKRVVNSKPTSFEEYGFKYVGVVDGNNIKELVRILGRVKRLASDKAVLIHVKTTKGKGYKKAEEKSDLYHGVSAEYKNESGNFARALGDKLNELIEKDNRIVALTAGMKDGTGLEIVEKVHPDNFMDVGIAEEYAVTLASGLARGGLKPFVCIYSTFMQRAYDQIIHDVCLQRLPVVFLLDRAGVVGADGKTHQGVFDISYLSHIPNIRVFAPNNSTELCDIIDYALTLNEPIAIRYPKNGDETENNVSVETAPWLKIKDGNKVTLLAVGPNMLNLAKRVAEKVDGVAVYSVRMVKPLCEKTLVEVKNTSVITLEENSEIGGFGSAVASFYVNSGEKTPCRILGIKDKFVEHGSINSQLESNHLTEQCLLEEIKKMI